MEAAKKNKFASPLFYLKIFVTASLLWLVVRKVDLTELGPILRRCDLKLVFAGILIGVGNSVFQALRWKILINNAQIKFWKYLHFIYLGYFFKIFLPGSVTGDFAKVYLFSRKYKEPISNSTMIPIFQMMGILFQWILAGVGLLVYRDIFNPALILSQFQIKWGLIIALILILILVIILAFKFKPIKSNVFTLNIKKSLSDPMLMAKSMGITFILQILSFLNAFVVMKSIGIDIPFFLLVSVFAIINTILVIPISISGVGVLEFFSIFFMHDILHFSKERVFSANIIGYGIILLFALMGGTWYLFRKLKEGKA